LRDVADAVGVPLDRTLDGLEQANERSQQGRLARTVATDE
jgi:hypothetical protein